MSNVDELRNLAGMINRSRKPGLDAKILEGLYSPPFRGDSGNEKDYTYPTQLSGLHHFPKQKVSISGDTSGQISQGNASGSYGMPTGGSHMT